MTRLLLALLLCSAVRADIYYVAVAGLGGEPDYEKRFLALAEESSKLMTGSGTTKSQVLAGEKATKIALRDVLQKISTQVTAEDSLILLLIGHGTFDGAQYKFNLTGPDLTADELAAMLEKIPAKQVVVNTSSCSGASIPLLKKKGRVVISATRSGGERLATVFARYWVEGLRDGSADADKNDAVSALEAYRYADQKTAKYYETQKRIATEHALLEDSGKSDGVRAPSPENGEGMFAASAIVLRTGAAQTALQSPEKQKLLAQRDSIEQQIDKLKYEKAAIPADEYRKQLTALLTELAKVSEAIDQ